ncbi:hypothetical protein [Phyllobacterium sp. K27]
MQKHLVAVREEKLGEDWLTRFIAGRDAAANWYSGQGLKEPSTTAECRSALLQHIRRSIVQLKDGWITSGQEKYGHSL